jgi:hypothetical protein
MLRKSPVWMKFIVTGVLALLLLGGIFVLTSAIGFCPIYALVGLSTCPTNKR